ncbi:hypothetical protein O181_040248 [Austropuccinia psidii MF-1]|uniref:Uncharacterized protein n=1 Tax=Austropuccinia psidii MF-1 TaxID=1389203 RepID=A0A9Q3DGU5_9BASI|nr:hypothetical protein [Austropuccinia psidii MF-1]
MSPLQVSNQNVVKFYQIHAEALFWVVSSWQSLVAIRPTSTNTMVNAWSSKAPGMVYPKMGAKLAAEEQESILKQLFKGLVAIQVSFSIFESPGLRSLLQ